jgi:putative peptidoglycan lipid II flippase
VVTEHSASFKETQGQAVWNSGIISVFNAVGFASALLVDVVVVAHFGLSRDTDAFFVASSLPQLVASILLVAYNSVLVPIFTKISSDGERQELWSLSSNLANLSLLGFSLLGGLGILGSSVLIRVQGAGLATGTRELAISLSKVLFLMIVPLGAVEVFKAALNSLRDFAFPAATTLVKNSGTLLVLLFFRKSLGIHALALGYTVASWLQFLLLWTALRIKGFRHQFVLDWTEPRTVEAFRQMRFPFSGAILGQSNILVERFLAGFLPAGAVSALGYARRVLRAITSIFIGSIPTAFLPRLSAQSTEGNLDEFRESLSLALRLGISISFPVTAAVFGLSIFGTQLVFGRGAFELSSARAVAGLLNLYIVSLPTLVFDGVFRAAFYAFEDTKTPFVIRAISLVANVVFDLVLFLLLGAQGLALALTVARIVGTYLIARRFFLWHRLSSATLLRFGGKIGVATLVVGGSLFTLENMVLRMRPAAFDNTLYLMGWLSLGIVGGGLLFVLLMAALRVEEVFRIRDSLLSQLSSRFN